MRHLRTVLITLAAGTSFVIGSAQAQAPYGPAVGAPPITTPPVSPYINLGRTGSPAINYFGLVRPELNFRNSILQLQRQAATTQQAITEVQDAALPATGHPSRFLNYSPYFMNLSGGTGTTANRSAAPTSIGRQPSRTATTAAGGGLGR